MVKKRRGKLKAFSIGFYDDQIVFLEYLEMTLGKGKARVLRDALDDYMQKYNFAPNIEGERGTSEDIPGIMPGYPSGRSSIKDQSHRNITSVPRRRPTRG